MSIFAGRYAGRCAIVTGGASGLGKQVAARIVAEGGKVVLWDVNPDALAAAGIPYLILDNFGNSRRSVLDHGIVYAVLAGILLGFAGDSHEHGADVQDSAALPPRRPAALGARREHLVGAGS